VFVLYLSDLYKVLTNVGDRRALDLWSF